MRLRTQKRASGRRITKTALMLGGVVAALALIAAGCGGDDSSSEAAGTTTSGSSSGSRHGATAAKPTHGSIGTPGSDASRARSRRR